MFKYYTFILYKHKYLNDKIQLTVRYLLVYEPINLKDMYDPYTFEYFLVKNVH